MGVVARQQIQSAQRRKSLSKMLVTGIKGCKKTHLARGSGKFSVKMPLAGRRDIKFGISGGATRRGLKTRWRRARGAQLEEEDGGTAFTQLPIPPLAGLPNLDLKMERSRRAPHKMASGGRGAWLDSERRGGGARGVYKQTDASEKDVWESS